MPVSREDWSLHRKASRDQERHAQKVRDAIKDNLAEVVANEDIIMSDGKQVVKVPIRSRQDYRFRYDPKGDSEKVGQGNGNTKKGDVIGNDGTGPGKGPQAGDQPGVDYYEVGLTLDELAELLFEDMGLPNLQDKRTTEVETDSVRFTDIRKRGIMSNLDKRRTILENIKRNAKKGDARFKDINDDDLRFRTWDVRREPRANAVVIAMMDVSGSMGEFEKYIARTFYFWMVRFLRTKHDNVKVVFISHTTEAKEVTEADFFTRGESGGTKVSSAYQLALDIITERFNPEDWNIYPFHFSDGDNMFSDNPVCISLINALMKVCNMFGYGQIKQGWNPPGTLATVYEQAGFGPKFTGITIEKKEDVYPALKRFFSLDEAERNGKA